MNHLARWTLSFGRKCRIFVELQSELGKTIIFVTHDPDEAVRLGDNIAILKDGELIQHGAPMQILTSPKSDYIRTFVRR